MKRNSDHYSLFVSSVLHLFVLAIAFFQILPSQMIVPEKNQFQVSLESKVLTRKSNFDLAPKAKSTQLSKLDIRPSFMKGSISSVPSLSAPSVNEGMTGEDVLARPLKVISAFDHLAAQINRNLDYPNLLVENNVQGTAALDLEFDEFGRVNEARSRFSGSHLAIRGLLAKASRLALVEWYKSDAYRLNHEQFKGQRFRTEFSVSYVEPEWLDRVDKTSLDVYQITKRRFKNNCVYPGSLDLICTALKVKGAVENAINEKSRIQFDLLMDKLNHYDDIGLSGINDLIRES